MDSEPTPENEPRKLPDVKREYHNDQIVVRWEPKLCNHTGNCFRGLPEVFQTQNRPWVLVDAASAEKIAEVVMTCPTGALHFERLDVDCGSLSRRRQQAKRALMVHFMFEARCELSGQADT